ncbi:MAG: hypothetical protein P8Z31_02250 [Gammaproteobacteria bacterium]|jgi:uncharacterized membrane protein YraQ (UPF0718 family)
MPLSSRRNRDRLQQSLRKSSSMFFGILPVIIGVILLTGLLIKLLPAESAAGWFGRNATLDAVIGALIGSISAGHPVSSYLLGGELLNKGVSLVAVTAFLVSWVTVGSIQLPAEAVSLGWRFALLRNLLCFLSSILVALLVVAALALLG